MKRIFAGLLLSLLWCSHALALTQASVPPKFPVPWGNAAGVSYIRAIPEASQIGIQNCAASLTDGFPPLTFVPASAGGCPPFGKDFNGILKQLSQWGLWLSAGSPTLYDASFQTSIGGYPMNGQLASASPGCYFVSTVDNNVTNPTSGGAGWVTFCPATGTIVPLDTTTGSGNAQVLGTNPFSRGVGSVIQFIPGFTNTGATTLNVNSLGAAAVVKQTTAGTTALVGGEITAGVLARVVYTGSNYLLLNGGDVFSIDGARGDFTISGLLTRTSQDLGVPQASKAQQQTGTSNAVGVTPLHQQDHDSAVKAWVSFGGSGSIAASYNVTSVGHPGTGSYQINLTTAFASGNYVCSTGESAAVNALAVTSKTASVQGLTRDSSGNPADIGAYVVCYGRQ